MSIKDCIKILLGFEKKSVVWEDYYEKDTIGFKGNFTYTIYHYDISDKYELVYSEPIRIYLSKEHARDMPMYITAMKKLREFQSQVKA